jgi:hypothetical protein
MGISLVAVLTACGGGSGDSTTTTADMTAADSTEVAAGWKKIKRPGSTTTTSTTTSTSTSSTTTPATSTSTSTSTSTDITGRIVPAEFFGMHLAAQGADGWPSVKFATQRIWDSWPGVSWADINPSQGTYNWANLDALVNDSFSHGVELVYTFGYVPAWASTNAGGACDGATAGSCYAPQTQAWTDFVTQITTRYKGKIKYWEMWNEPNAGNFWKGSNAQLVTMAKAAAPIIHNAGGTVLSPAPQGTNSHVWMDGYFAAGGASYTDITTFHGYLYSAPEAVTTLADNMRSVQNKYGLSGKPLWDTEHSWGDSTWPMGADQDQQSAWLARYVVLSFSQGIDRSFWYGWEHFNWGTLYDRTTKQILKPGIAYGQVYGWMVGAGMSPCTNSGGVYQCQLSRANGYHGTIVWNANGQSSFTVPAGDIRMRTIDAQSTSVSAGQSVTIGIKPVLIENQAI